MIQELEAIFDGTNLQPKIPLNLEAGTRVRIVVESVVPEVKQNHRLFFKLLSPYNCEEKQIGRSKLTIKCRSYT